MSQFIEVIESLDTTGDTIVSRYPPDGAGEIKLGAQLIVRESQAAIFFRDGRALDTFGPGRHTLSTLNIPLLTKALSLPTGFVSPFRAEVYFVNLKTFADQKWGTTEPILFRDDELQMVRLPSAGSTPMGWRRSSAASSSPTWRTSWARICAACSTSRSSTTSSARASGLI
jgi:membrane protease subunit (stomatin/prohibitin family)